MTILIINRVDRRRIWPTCILGLVLLVSACAANEQILRSGQETPLPSNVDRPVSSLDGEVTAMRDADFRFIWVLRRKDGGVLDAADKNVIRVNTVDMNRRVIADGEHAVVIGTNALPPRKNLDALFSYFSVEDLSPVPMPEPITNSNAKAKR